MLNYLDTRPWAVKRSAFPAVFARWATDRFAAHSAGFASARLVDWGAGKGDFMDAFEKCGWFCSGFDLIPKTPAVVQADFSEPLALRTVPLAEADAVVCRNVLEHLSNPSHLLEGIRRNMKPNAVTCFAVPDWRTYAPIFYSDYTHQKPYDATSLTDLLRTSGFTILEVVEIVQHPWWFQSRLAKAYAAFARAVVPLSIGEWLSKTTGNEFWKFACLRTVVAFVRKGN